MENSLYIGVHIFKHIMVVFMGSQLVCQFSLPAEPVPETVYDHLLPVETAVHEK